MRRFTTVFIFSVFVLAALRAQTGIGTSMPNPSAVLDLTAKDKALLLPRIDSVGVIPNPVNGMLIYDLSAKCIRGYENNSWTDCMSISSPSSVLADCDKNGFVGNYSNVVAMTAGNKFSVTLTNNSFTTANIAFDKADLTLSGVSGVSVASVMPTTATLIAGQSQQVEYTLSGTPATKGILTGVWKKLYLDCTKTIAINGPAITSLNCGGTTFTGVLTEKTAATNVSFTIGYDGGDGSSYAGQSVASTGVTGLTATLTAGSFASGSGNLTYTITGTPSGVGEAYFPITIGGKNCQVGIPVEDLPIILPYVHTMISTYDEDYLPYATPTGTASTTRGVPADGTKEAKTIDIQGQITTTGIEIEIPIGNYTDIMGSNFSFSEPIGAYSTTVNVPKELTEDGISRNLTLSWEDQKTSGEFLRSIKATVKAVDGTLNLKKLDINGGLGKDHKGIELVSFPLPKSTAYPSDLASPTLTIRFNGGVPDKMFGVPDAKGNKNTRDMLYLPSVYLMQEYGNPVETIWLNNNLGSAYNNMNSSAFNPSQLPIAPTDYLGYGSLFQYNAPIDGRELMTYSNATTGTPVYPELYDKNHNDNTPVAISNFNPCPSGFRLINVWVLDASVGQLTWVLFRPTTRHTAPGFRDPRHEGIYTASNPTFGGQYWRGDTSNANPSWAPSYDPDYDIYGVGELNGYNPAAFGFAARCVLEASYHFQ